jgi:hypothetical protein
MCYSQTQKVTYPTVTTEHQDNNPYVKIPYMGEECSSLSKLGFFFGGGGLDSTGV